MKVIYITRFFEPEPGAASVRASECVRHLSDLGHQVTVVTGFPNYLVDKISAGYRNRILSRESFGDARLIRTFTLADSRTNILKKLMNQVFFAAFALLGGLFASKCDAVIVTSPPFPAVVSGWLLSVVKRAAFVFEVRDLYPGSAKAFGLIENSMLLRALTWVEEFMYRRADAIVCATQGLAADITSRGISEAKVTTVLNGVDTDRFRPDIDGASLRKSLNLDGKQIVAYTGIFGRAHGLSVVLDAAELLKKRADITFLLVGDGADREFLVEEKRRRNLHNVLFIGPQPHKRIPEFIACADACLATLREGEFTKRSVPAKMFEYMASGRPVLLSGNGEAANLLEAADAGICVESNDPGALAEAISTLCADPEARRRYGENGRLFVEKYLSRRELAGHFGQALLTAVERPDLREKK